MSHAPYMAQLAAGRVMVVWFSGSREWAKDVHLLAATYHADAGMWEPITDLVAEVGYSVGNCVTQIDNLGKLNLWYVRTKGYWHEGEIVHMVWPDLKLGFTSKTVLSLAKGWLVRGRPIMRGSLVYLPVYNEKSYESAIYTLDLTSREGKLSEFMNAEGGLIQPTLIEVTDNEFRCFMRNPRSPNRIHFAYSMDRGLTWSRPFATSLPNPNSGLDVVSLPDSRLLCAYNNSEKNRYPLSLAVSDSGGMDWRRIGDVEHEEGEFSYPSMLRRGEEVYLAYTYKRESIKFTQLDIKGI